MRKFVLAGAIALSTGLIPPPVQGQPLPPEQMIRKHLQQVGSSMVSALPKVAAYSEVGKLIAVDGWRVIKTGATTSVGENKKTGLIAIFDADPNQDGSTKDTRFIVLQLHEWYCPSSVANNPRLENVPPSAGTTATAVIQNQQIRVTREGRSLDLATGSYLERLICE